MALWNVKVVEAEHESDDIVTEHEDIPGEDLPALLESLRTKMRDAYEDHELLEYYMPDQRIVLTLVNDGY